jgi:hypothetical protein
MCVCKELSGCKAKSPRSPFRRHTVSLVLVQNSGDFDARSGANLDLSLQPVKPRLSRKIVSSARVNLNCYWAKFEELTTKPLIPCSALDNEINENLANEIRDLGN